MAFENILEKKKMLATSIFSPFLTMFSTLQVPILDFESSFICHLPDWMVFLRRFQQYFSHITATAHIIHVFPGFHQY